MGLKFNPATQKLDLVGGSSNVNEGSAQGQMAFWDDTLKKWTYTETSEMFWDDVNKRLGVGTATPTYSFHVKAASFFEGILVAGSSVYAPSVGTYNYQNADFLVRAQAGYAIKFLTGTTEYMRVGTTGNVGIGTSSPGTKLDVSSSANTILARFTSTKATATSLAFKSEVLGAATNNVGFQAIAQGGTNNTFALLGDVVPPTGNFSLYSAVNFNSYFAGNVGIGTSSPSQALDLIGNLELEDTTTSGTGIIYKGTYPFLHNFHHPTGSTAIPVGHNLFIGISAGNLTTGSTATNDYEASNNIGIGDGALNKITIGAHNVAIGYNCLFSVTDSSNNTAIGENCLRSSTASFNTAIGTNTMYSSTTGHSNTGFGAGNLFSLTTGSSNMAFGRDTMTKITTATGNMAIGNYAGRDNADTSFHTSGDYSMYIGLNSKASANGVSNEIVIGYNAVGNGSNTITLGNDNIATTILKGNVGIGTSSPSSQLQITGNFEIPTTSSTVGQIKQNGATIFHTYFEDGTSSFNNIFIGKSAGNFTLSRGGGASYLACGNFGIGESSLKAITTGYYNVAVGTLAGTSLTTGASNFALGHQALLLVQSGIANVAIGRDAMVLKTTNSSYNISIGQDSMRASGAASKNVSIGHQSGYSVTTGGSNIFLGYCAGYRQTTNSNLLIIDNQQRADEATELSNSILYGVIASTPASQTLRINAKTGISIDPTAYLTLPAGTATAGTAPLKFTAGVLNTTAEAGTIEYTTNQFHIRGNDGLSVAGNIKVSGGFVNTGNLAITYDGDFVDTVTVGSRVTTYTNDGTKYTSWTDTVNTWTPTYSGDRITNIIVT